MLSKLTLPLLALALLIAFAIPAQAFHILLDPGHGGIDTGTTRGAWKESQIALEVSRKVAALLRADKRFKVSMTRDSDETVKLPRRAQIARELKPDLFVSIHLNSSTDPRAHGREFYFQNQLPADEESLFLASKENEEEGESDEASAAPERMSSESDVKRILEDLRRNERVRASSELSKILLQTWREQEGGGEKAQYNRAIRQAPFYVVSKVPAPSILVEIGFLTHTLEGPKLAQNAYQDEIAHGIYEALVKYKETMDKRNPANLE